MIKAFFVKQCESINQALFIRLFKLYSAAALLVIAYAFVFSGFQIVDEFEHLHASWLISIGKLPYRDFFEHHHPLLWYLSAPVVSFFYDNTIIFYVMRGVSSVVSLLTLYFIYKTVLFWGNKSCGWAAVALTLGNIITIYNFCQFRPDNFMNCCFVAGLYYWFCFLYSEQTKKLIYSFLAFTLSALFLQKISLLLIVVEIIILWLMYRKIMPLKTTFTAALPSLALALIFWGYFYHKGILPEYFEFNFHFNMELVYYTGRGSFWLNKIFLSLYGLAAVSAVFFFRRENIAFKITAVIYWAEFIMRAFYFAPHPNYYTLLTMLEAMILSVWFKSYALKYKFTTIAAIIAMFVYLGSLFNTVVLTSEHHNSYTHYQMADYIHKNSAPEDILLNGYDNNFNIYRQDASYYWFGVEMLLPVMKQKYNMGQEYDLNALIYQKHPKFLYLEDFIDLFALRAYGETKYTQRYDLRLISLLYQPTSFNKLVELK